MKRKIKKAFGVLKSWNTGSLAERKFLITNNR